MLKALQTQKDPERKGLDPRILLTAMSLSLQAKAADRVHPLFEVFSPDGAAMTVDDFIACIGTRPRAPHTHAQCRGMPAS